MRLGLNLQYLTARSTPAQWRRLARAAERLDYEVVWAAEAYGSDSPSMLAWLAGATERVDLGSAVMQIPGRTPAATAMTAATVDAVSGGRFRLGLGVSGPQVSEGWHGVRFARPLARTREYVDIVRRALARERVSYDGEHFRLPLPDGPGKPLKLGFHPPRPEIPIYLAAIGPRNLHLAGEIADGVLLMFFTAEHGGEQVAAVARGRAEAGRPLEGFDVVANVPVVTGDDIAACGDLVRPHAALYVGGMGSKEQNFYYQLAVRMGYADAARQIQEHYLAGRYRDAAAAVPSTFLDQIALLGPRDRIADRLRALADTGATTVSVTPADPDPDVAEATLRTVAEAAQRAAG